MIETKEDPAEQRLSARFTRWFLLTGNRLLVSLVILAGMGVTFFVVAILEIATVTSPSRVMWFLNGTVNGLLTLVPITVGVNQIVLSHEFGSMQNLYDRRTNITDFRERVEEQTETTVTSPNASTFFGTLLSSVSVAVETIQRGRGLPEDDRARNEIESVAESVGNEAVRANDKLAANDTSMLRTLLVMLTYNNTQQFHEIRRLQKEFSDCDEGTTEELQRINELFVEIDVARQFLKTVVIERQLARLSRFLIYTSIPAVTIAAIGIFAYRDIAGLTVPHVFLVVITGSMIVTTLAPLAILGAYVLRVSTIARQTAAYGPFIP